MQDRRAQTGIAAAWSGLLHDPAAHAVVALGVTQIIAWGTTLYALGVLGKPIAADTGWSQGVVFGGLTVGLLTSAAVSAVVGRLLDRHGGRAVGRAVSGVGKSPPFFFPPGAQERRLSAQIFGLLRRRLATPHQLLWRGSFLIST